VETNVECSQVTFSVNGVVVPKPVTTLPLSGPMSKSPPKYAITSDTSKINWASNNLPSRTISLFVPAAEDLYPTVTLHSPATAVMCRFSAQDLVASSRESIGAPESVAVYAVDGSVVFPENS
jgi:hypothetical protein